ncbi:replicative DNA helicase [Neorhodopirellula pilleata]|uniref:DNA 5'-3' helicase n=1 Tax=Neorhodopirellula pilleata TaxID=2714738 RepID=A0A5C5ZZA0_9BACT|nr:DnaB-like helicase C-terminal domain-containing protein [Neorhodopirellula pilleata]TWT91653.1 Replicative DNA helicase [Neorhodopirellula pilleata]
MNDPTPIPMSEIENALLYAVLIDRQQIHVARSIVSSDDFTGPRRRLFAEISDLIDAGGDHGDITQLLEHLRSVNALSAIGGAGAVAAILDSSATPGNASTYARQVKTAANRRRVSAMLASASDRIDDPSDSLDAILDRLIGDVSAIRATSTTATTVSIYEAGLQVLKHINDDTESTGGVYSGIPAIDGCFGAFAPGTLTTIAARTSIGKSGLCLQAANNISLGGGQVLYLSMEMPAIELAFRCLGNSSQVDSQRIANRALTNDERVHLVDALAQYKDAGLFIDDSPHQTAASIASAARSRSASTGLDAIFVDHIGLIGYPFTQKRNEAIADASRSMKRLAKELGIPVFMACQINRKGDEAGNYSRPRLSHLADSTSIEADSDNVIILHRDRPVDPITTFAFEKVRNGQKGVRKMRMDLPSTWFVDADSPTWHDMQPHEEFMDHATN